MNVIFLDIDGVLNSEEFERNIDQYQYVFKFSLLDQKAILRLYKILWETNAYVVLSSSWRLSEESYKSVEEQLKPYRIKLIDKTPQNTEGRGAEIVEWLEQHPEVSHYVVLDDDDFAMEPVKNHLVLTTWTDGLEDKHIQEAIDKMKLPYMRKQYEFIF